MDSSTPRVESHYSRVAGALREQSHAASVTLPATPYALESKSTKHDQTSKSKGLKQFKANPYGLRTETPMKNVLVNNRTQLYIIPFSI